VSDARVIYSNPRRWVIKLGESRWITKVTIKKNVEEENTFIAEARVSRSVGGKASAEDYLLRPRIPCHRAAHRAIKLNRKVCTRKPRKLYAIYIKSGELAGTASRWKEKKFPSLCTAVERSGGRVRRSGRRRKAKNKHFAFLIKTNDRSTLNGI
jgi:hypothetical protein